jgi:hypothetical protein
VPRSWVGASTFPDWLNAVTLHPECSADAGKRHHVVHSKRPWLVLSVFLLHPFWRETPAPKTLIEAGGIEGPEWQEPGYLTNYRMSILCFIRKSPIDGSFSRRQESEIWK